MRTILLCFITSEQKHFLVNSLFVAQSPLHVSLTKPRPILKTPPHPHPHHEPHLWFFSSFFPVVQWPEPSFNYPLVCNYCLVVIQDSLKLVNFLLSFSRTGITGMCHCEHRYFTFDSMIKTLYFYQVVVAHPCNPSLEEAEAGGSLCLCVSGQPGLQSEFQDSQG